MRRRTLIGTILLGIPLALILCCLFLIVFVRTCRVDREEIDRVRSPDSALDAVTIRTNPGAMSSYIYGVFIVPADGKPDHKDEVFRGIKLHEMQAKWKEPRVLEIHYGPGMAEISHFRESWSNQRHNLSVEVRLVTPGGIRYKPIPSQRAHSKALSNHDVSVVSYEIWEGIFRGALWPSKTNPNFRIGIIVGKKELFYDIPPPPEFGMYEKEVTEDWNFEATETHDEIITFVASRKDENTSVQIELPKKSKKYGFSALRNSSGEVLLVFMNPSETVFDEGLFGYVFIRNKP